MKHIFCGLEQVLDRTALFWRNFWQLMSDKSRGDLRVHFTLCFAVALFDEFDHLLCSFLEGLIIIELVWHKIGGSVV